MELITAANEAFEVYASGQEDAMAGILIIHDWWGMLDYNREWADRFAAAGYYALVADLYAGHHPESPKAAGEFMRSLDQKSTDRKLTAALTTLKTQRRKVGVLGWSFGGLQAQRAVLNNPLLVDAVVLYYCRIIFNRENASGIHVPVLAVFAEAESTWPDKQADLENIMAKLNNPLKCYSYDAAHGFVNPDSLNYDDEASEDGWQNTLTFLNTHLH